MFIKKGNIENKITSQTPILVNPQGKRFEVSFIAAFIWNGLNGATPVQELVKEIQNTARMDSPELFNVAQEIVKDLRKVDLVEELRPEAVKR